MAIRAPDGANKHLSPFTSLVFQLKSSNSTIFFLGGLHIIFYICLTVVVKVMEEHMSFKKILGSLLVERLGEGSV